MAFPTLRVRVAFDSDPLDDTPTWTDLSSRILGLSVRTGRQQELDSFQPGRATFVFANEDRALDPLHATGPYFGKVLPRKRIQVHGSLNGGGTWYGLFDGFVDGWPQTYSPPGLADITITATDIFVLLANIELPSSVYAIEVAADAPNTWHRLGEERGDSMQDSSANRYDGLYLPDTASLSTRHPNQWETTTGLDLDGVHWGKVTDAAAQYVPVVGEVNNTTMEAVIRLPLDLTATSGDRFLMVAWSDGAGTYHGQLAVYASTSSTFTLYASQRGYGGGAVTATGLQLVDGNVHHVAYRLDTANVQYLTVDGVAYTTGSPGPALPIFDGYYVGGHPDVDSSTNSFRGVLAEVAVYDYDIGAARVEAHASALLAPWAEDTTGARVDRVLDLAAIPASMRDIAAGVSTPAPARLPRTVLTYCQVMEATEQGAFFFDHVQGLLRLRDRHETLTATRSTTVQATFADDATGINYDVGQVVLVYDEQQVYNEAVVAWGAGEDVAVEDAASIAAYGRRSIRIQTQARSGHEARAIGEWIVTHYKDPVVRVNSLTFSPGSDDTADDAALQLRVGDRVTVKLWPQKVGAQASFDCLVEGKDHAMSDGVRWTTTLYLSPAELLDVFLLNDSLLDSAAVLAI